MKIIESESLGLFVKDFGIRDRNKDFYNGVMQSAASTVWLSFEFGNLKLQVLNFRDYWRSCFQMLA